RIFEAGELNHSGGAHPQPGRRHPLQRAERREVGHQVHQATAGEKAKLTRRRADLLRRRREGLVGEGIGRRRQERDREEQPHGFLAIPCCWIFLYMSATFEGGSAGGSPPVGWAVPGCILACCWLHCW